MNQSINHRINHTSKSNTAIEEQHKHRTTKRTTMIMTMTAPDDSTTVTVTVTTTSDHDTAAMKMACAPTTGTGTRISSEGNDISSSSSSSGSCTSLASSCSNSTSCTITSTTLKAKKRVSFGLQQTAYFSPEQLLSREERKNECWYSEAELNLSRDEARMTIQALHHQLQLDAAAATGTTTGGGRATTATPVSEEYGSWVLRCPQDETKVVCLRGIEKYADATAKYVGQKRLVSSVLQQQTINNKEIHVSLVSRTLSEPFKEVARYYAMKSAEELDMSRKIEEQQQEMERKQREEVATVLLLIMGQHNNQKQQQQPPSTESSPSPSPSRPSSSSSRLQQASPIVTPRGSISNKRSSFTNSPLSESRNVKPCIRATFRSNERTVTER